MDSRMLMIVSGVSAVILITYALLSEYMIPRVQEERQYTNCGIVDVTEIVFDSPKNLTLRTGIVMFNRTGLIVPPNEVITICETVSDIVPECSNISKVIELPYAYCVYIDDSFDIKVHNESCEAAKTRADVFRCERER